MSKLYLLHNFFSFSILLKSQFGVMQRQWWEFKSKHMDKVMFFKVFLLLKQVK